LRNAAKIAGGAAAAGMAGWAAYSYKMMNKPIPLDGEARAYAKSLMEKVGLGEFFDTWREERIRAGDNELALYHFESEPGDPTMVFVPGTSIYALVYIEYLYKLSKQGFNVVGFDPRGHGMSSGKRGVYTLGELVDDAVAVIDHAVNTYGDNVAVSGSSQGGMVAFYCAAAEPRLKAAVCHNIIAPDEPDNERMTRWPGFYGILLGMSKLPFIQPLLNTPMGYVMPPVSAYLDLEAEPCRVFPALPEFFREDPLIVNAVSLSALASLGATPMAVRVEDIKTPVMVVHPGEDNIFPEDYVRRVYDRLNCEKEWLYLEGKPHLVLIDYVDEILPTIAEWLKKVMAG
jgi:pimeloyl-ACP methyl ester carboxylesterase